MNQEQALALVRMLLTSLGSVLVARGLIEPDQLNSDVGLAVTAVGAAMPVGAIIWSIWSKTRANTIAAAAKLPNVQQIVTDQTTADKVPSAKVVGPSS